MDNRKTQLTTSTRLWIIAFLLTIFAASTFYWYPNGRLSNIMALQFTSNIDAFTELLRDIPLIIIETNTYLDFFFIVCFSFLFYASYRLFQTSMRIKVSKLFIVLCLLPGVFDIVENVLFLKLANNLENSVNYTWYWRMVRSKWTLIIPFFLINITILIYYAVKILNRLVKYLKKKK